MLGVEAYDASERSLGIFPTANRAVNAISGSLAFGAAARLTFISIEEQDNAKDPYAALAASAVSYDNPRRLLLPDKNNLGPKARGLGYRHNLRAVANDITASFVEWDDVPVTITADEALAAAANKHKESKLDDAKEWLHDYLKDGPVTADKLEKAADKEEITKATLRRAKKALRVVTERAGFGKQGEFHWRLPTQKPKADRKPRNIRFPGPDTMLKSDALDYHGPIVDVPNLGPDSLDEHGAPSKKS